MNDQGSPSSFGPGDVDLFGPDPEADPLAYYTPPAPAGDLYAQSTPEVRTAWRTLAQGFATQCHGDLSAMQSYLDRHVEDLGLAFRMTGDEQERPWPSAPCRS